jgi:hypothetical protein
MRSQTMVFRAKLMTMISFFNTVLRHRGVMNQQQIRSHLQIFIFLRSLFENG